MVEQMVCKRDKTHCSPIRRRFLTLIVAALLLTTAEAQTERVPWSKRTKTSVLVARRDARAKHEHGPAAIFASSNATSTIYSLLASSNAASTICSPIDSFAAIEACKIRETSEFYAKQMETPEKTHPKTAGLKSMCRGITMYPMVGGTRGPWGPGP